MQKYYNNIIFNINSTQKAKLISVLVYFVLPIIFNIFFNAIFKFNVDVANKNNQAEVVSALLFIMFIIQICAYFYLRARYSFFLYNSALIVFIIFWLGINEFLPFIVGVMFYGLKTNILNIVAVYVQIIFYFLLLLYYFKNFKNSSSQIKIFPHKTSKNGRFFILNILMPIILCCVLIAMVFGMNQSINTVISFFKGSIFFGNKVSSTSNNQKGLVDLTHNISGKVALFLLSIIFAPLVEEICTRHILISTCLYSNSMSRESNLKYKFIFYLMCSSLVSIVFFANMHVLFDKIAYIKYYLIASIMLTASYILNKFNCFYNFFIHSGINLIAFIFIVS